MIGNNGRGADWRCTASCGGSQLQRGGDLPLVERVQTDNGSEFGASFHWHLLDKGIDHVRIKPHPRLNGKVERSHRIDSEEFYRLLKGQVIDDANLFSEKLQEWEDYYNYHRPHGALDGQTPYERLRQKAQDPLSVAHCHPDQCSALSERISAMAPESLTNALSD